MSCSSRCWLAVDLSLIPLSAMSAVLIGSNLNLCSDIIFDLALDFFFVVRYHLRDMIYKHSVERSHTSEIVNTRGTKAPFSD